jgi:hypothetical protein
MMQATAWVFGMEPVGAVTASTYDSGTPTVLTLWSGWREFGAPVRCPGGGWELCMMLAAARVFGM